MSRPLRRRLSERPTFFLLCMWFACVWMALSTRNASPWLLASFRDFEPAEHVPRTSARAHTCTAVSARASCVPRNREHDKRPAGGRAKNVHVQNKSVWSGLVQSIITFDDTIPTSSNCCPVIQIHPVSCLSAVFLLFFRVGCTGGSVGMDRWVSSGWIGG